MDAPLHGDGQLLDDVDREIIDQLRIDGRRSFAEIGRRIGFSEPTVRQRYNRLVSLGVIWVAGMYDETKIGGVAAHVGIRVTGMPVAKVAEQLVEHPSIKYVACTLGYYDIILDVAVPDARALGRIVLYDLRRIRGVSEIETLTVLEVRKDTYLWQGFREPPPAQGLAPAAGTGPAAP
ncbi:Lrp/AsnC family transcriptional regulator [Leucobacter weissii]|uniref:Lrp/AsnC family transcriptional regulator n=1 Tax=Leucobacter weissii TaxID=1983706 RepID=A0A939MJN4_9MICO|nr:Lrp/AsnC family transcriptional regulator [Leucobacter weissii]MBO1901215.1 Lrp/AsnC family transcriptional regulator [Leucobacter weissii]